MQTPIASINVDESLCNKLLNLPSHKVSASRTGIKFACMKQMMLLNKMDPKRLKKKRANKSNFCTHECEHCKKLMNSRIK